MEKELPSFSIQELHGFFQVREMVMGVPEYTDFQRETPPILCGRMMGKMVPEMTLPLMIARKFLTHG